MHFKDKATGEHEPQGDTGATEIREFHFLKVSAKGFLCGIKGYFFVCGDIHLRTPTYLIFTSFRRFLCSILRKEP